MGEATTFGTWLKGRRRTRDLSREALAELASCAAPTLAKIEQGTRRPSRELAALLLDALQASPAERAHALWLARLPLAAGEASPAGGHTEQPAGEPGRSRPLPAPPSPLIGRADELRQLHERLSNPASRVVTLVGQGGVGKTRLALEAAAQLAGHFTDGAAWVELAAVADPADVAPAVADAVGYPRGGTAPLELGLLSFLRERRLLLVLDNLEHLPGVVALLTAIVRQAPALTLLLTSRRPLRLPGEWVVAVEGLKLPAVHGAPALEHHDATRLFVERARQAGGTLRSDPASRQAVAAICRLVEGVPLAIELAAAWIRTLTCEEIAHELAQSLALLAAPGGTSGRHASMAVVFEQSWSLLAPSEQRALAALAVFQGRFTREAAEQVAGASLAVLASLVELSLLRREDGQRSRYRMHELVRQFAAERLAPGLEAEARAAHAGFYTELLASSAPRLQGGEQLVTLALLDQERANIVQAWAWAAERSAEAMVIRGAPGLLLMHELRGQLREAAGLFRGAAARLRATRPAAERTGEDRALGVLCAWEGWARGRSGEVVASHGLLVEALSLLDGDDELRARTGALGSLGLILLQRGRYAEARVALEQSLALVIPRGLHFFATLHSVFLLNVRLAEGDVPGAAALGEQALAHAEAGGSRRARQLARCGAALVANLTGASDRAQELAREALRLAAAAHDPFGLGLALLMLGMAARVGGDLEEARYLLAESAEACAASGDHWNQGRALMQCGAAALAAGDEDGARGAWQEALEVTLGQAIDGVAISVAVELAALELGEQPEAARRLLAALRARPEADHLTRLRSTALLAGGAPAAQHDDFSTVMQAGDQPALAALLAAYPALRYTSHWRAQ